MDKNVTGNFKIYIYRIIRIAILVGVIACIYYVLDYAVSDDISSQTRVSFHDYYEADHVDNLFLGTSHTAKGINANRLSELTGTECYNLGTSRQTLLCSYYIIKEAISRGNVDRIFCEISIDSLFWKEGDETSTFIVSDYLDSPVLSYELIMNELDSASYMNAFFRVRRWADNIKDIDKVKKNIKAKRKDSYRGYKGDKLYLGRGQWKVSNDSPMFPDGEEISVNLNSSSFKNKSIDKIRDYNWKAYTDILDLCSKSNTELVLYIMPMQECYVKYFEDYDLIMEKLQEAASAAGVKFIDLNTVKEEYYPLVLSDFRDLDHVTTDGSLKLAQFLASYISSPNEDYFYSNWKDKYNGQNKIIATGYRIHYLSDEGEYDVKSEVQGDINGLKVELTAFALENIATDIVVSKVESVSGDPADDNWAELSSVDVCKEDAYVSGILIPYDDFKSYYKVSIYSHDNGELLYEVVTNFDMP